MNNWTAALITLAISIVWLRLMDFAAQRGWIESRLSRKIIHITTGPVFVLCWFLFRDTPDARWWAAAIPFLITLQFALIGTGILKDEASVQAMNTRDAVMLGKTSVTRGSCLQKASRTSANDLRRRNSAAASCSAFSRI